MLFALVFASFWVLFLVHQLYWRRRGLPPGPFPLPIIGNIHQIDTLNMEVQLLQWKKKYGNVFTVWIPDPQVIVSDSTNLKEFVTNGDAYAGRPTFNLMKLLLDGNYGLAFNEDSFWRNQRRFALHVLRDFGFGKSELEEAVVQQSKEMTEFLVQQNGEAIELSKLFTTVVGNIIHHVTFGYTVSLESDRIIHFRDTALEAFRIFLHPMGMLLELWTGLKVLDPLFDNILKKCMAKNDIIVDMIVREIEEHRKTIDFDSDARDYMDAFLMEQKRQHVDPTAHGEWSDRQLVASCYDLFTAGMETTATTLRTFVLYMIRHPEIQQKIFAEIDTVIGRDRVITMSDQVDLPYLQASIQEIQRIAVLISINLQHKTTKPVTLEKYSIPQGTTIIPQFQSVHLDDDVYQNPYTFDPTRHLDPKTGKYFKDEKILPFSLGKRSCLGESLARMELFIFAANLFQNFEFLPESEGKLPELKFVSAFVKAPLPFKCRIVPRVS